MTQSKESNLLVNLPKGLEYPVRIEKCHVLKNQHILKGDSLYTIEDAAGKKGVLKAPFDSIVTQDPVEAGAAFSRPIPVLTLDRLKETSEKQKSKVKGESADPLNRKQQANDNSKNNDSDSETISIKLPTGLAYPVVITACHVTNVAKINRGDSIYTFRDANGLVGEIQSPIDAMLESLPVEAGAIFFKSISIATLSPSVKPDLSTKAQETKDSNHGDKFVADLMSILNSSKGTAQRSTLEVYRDEVIKELDYKGYKFYARKLQEYDVQIEIYWLNYKKDKKDISATKRVLKVFLFLLICAPPVLLYLTFRIFYLDNNVLSDDVIIAINVAAVIVTSFYFWLVFTRFLFKDDFSSLIGSQGGLPLFATLVTALLTIIPLSLFSSKSLQTYGISLEAIITSAESLGMPLDNLRVSLLPSIADELNLPDIDAFSNGSSPNASPEEQLAFERFISQ